MPTEIDETIAEKIGAEKIGAEKIGQDGHAPLSGQVPDEGVVTLSATEARQGVPVGMVRRVLALSLVGAVLAMLIAYALR